MTGMEPAMILALAGTAVSAVGAVSAGAAQKQASDRNATMGVANAAAARRDATENARRQRRVNRKNAGTIRNQEFVAMDVLEDQVREGELKALDLLHAGEVKAIGLENGATLDRMQGKAAQRAGYFSAAGTLLKGGATAYESMGSTSGYSTVDTTTGRGMALDTSYGQGIYE